VGSGGPDENGILVSFRMIFPNGFKRLINNGYTFQNMHFNFMPTYTGPGHASIYTGTTPDTRYRR
jgi:predicted AlkP superfamily pyrophosphatase or phosphodiesterase